MKVAKTVQASVMVTTVQVKCTRLTNVTVRALNIALTATLAGGHMTG